jgi:hypothetical protein
MKIMNQAVDGVQRQEAKTTDVLKKRHATCCSRTPLI